MFESFRFPPSCLSFLTAPDGCPDTIWRHNSLHHMVLGMSFAPIESNKDVVVAISLRNLIAFVKQPFRAARLHRFDLNGGRFLATLSVIAAIKPWRDNSAATKYSPEMPLRVVLSLSSCIFMDAV
jgi:hypothetical protein